MHDERKKVGKPVSMDDKNKYYGKCDVRLTKKQDLELTKIAERNGVSRSDVMRRALDDLVKFNSYEED